MFGIKKILNQLLNKEIKDQVETTEEEVAKIPLPVPDAQIISIEKAYLKYEKIIFPEVTESNQVYTEEYLKKLDQTVEALYDLLPKACLRQALLSVNECFKGIVLGDMYGSPYEIFRDKANDYNVQDVPLQVPGHWTDDTVMTIATMRSVKDIKDNNKTGPEMIRSFADNYRTLAKQYPHSGYGGNFYDWAIMGYDDSSYISCGDGSAMRSGIVGALASNLKECIILSAYSALPTHAHPEGIKGAVCAAVMTFYALRGADKSALTDIAHIFYPRGARNASGYARLDYEYLAPDLSLYEIRELYPLTLKVTCQIALPIAISLFLLSDNYIDFIKHLSILPLDADTVGAMAGGMMIAWNQIHGDGVSTSMPDISCFNESADEQPEEILSLLGKSDQTNDKTET